MDSMAGDGGLKRWVGEVGKAKEPVTVTEGLLSFSRSFRSRWSALEF